MRACVHARTRACMRACVHARVRDTRARIHTPPTHTNTQSGCAYACTHGSQACGKGHFKGGARTPCQDELRDATANWQCRPASPLETLGLRASLLTLQLQPARPPVAEPEPVLVSTTPAAALAPTSPLPAPPLSMVAHAKQGPPSGSEALLAAGRLGTAAAARRLARCWQSLPSQLH